MQRQNDNMRIKTHRDEPWEVIVTEKNYNSQALEQPIIQGPARIFIEQARQTGSDLSQLQDPPSHRAVREFCQALHQSLPTA